MGFKKYGPSRNLLNKTGAQSGYITDDGTVVSEHANLMYTDYIPVSDDATSLTQSYDRNALVMGSPAMCFYDESKTYISGEAFNQAYTKTFQKPTNAKYIRTCYRTTMDWAMLNSGSTPLPYEPYGNIWQSINPKQLKGIPYTGTLPAVLAGTKAGYLHRYKVYGNVGENLFDISMVEQGGWNASAGTIPTKLVPSEVNYRIRCRYSVIIPLLATTLSLYCPSNIKINYVWIDVNGYSLGGSGWQKSGDTATAPEQAVSMTFILGLEGDVQCTPSDFYNITIVSGSTPPDHYIPYEECGERTGNLFDYKTMSVGMPGYYLAADGTESQSEQWTITDYIPCDGSNFVLSRVGGRSPAICGYNAQKEFVGGQAYNTTGSGDKRNIYVTFGADVNFIRFTYYSVIPISPNNDDVTTLMLTEGSTPPSSYIPFGYKLPPTSADQDVDIFIGDDTLSTEEYIDSGTGKIYRMISGVLTPVDPPVPFPQIPTSANSTTIIWGGQGLAPSQFDSIQEWVDIPTYKRVNGEWVADN